MRYRIITDSTGDLTPELIRDLQLTVIPMEFTIDGKSYTFDANGCRVDAGWTYIDGYRRYRNADGSLSNDVSAIFNPSSKYITVDRIRGITTIYGYNSETGKYDTPFKSMW